jgi:mannose-6-phosphate isomerase-like protein (cupin superfamily)
MDVYTIVPVSDVEDQAAEVGMDPHLFEIRFMREPLRLENFSVTFERMRSGCHGRGHRHTVQEEVVFLVSGRAQGKFGDELIDLEPGTAVRVPPATARGYRNIGEEDAIFVIIAAPQAGLDDAVIIEDYWGD